jgi:fucose permease
MTANPSLALFRHNDYTFSMPRSRRFSIFFIIYGNMVLYGFIQTIRGVVFPLVKNDFAASYSRQGLLVFLISVMSVLSCIAAGVFLSRFGFKRSLLFGFVLVIAGMASFYFVPAGNKAVFIGFWITAGVFLILQMGLGFFEIGLNGIGVKTFTKKSALMMSLLHFCYGVGAVIGPAFAGFIAGRPAMGWRLIYPLGIIPVGLMALLSFLLAPGRKAEAEASPVDNPAAGTAGNTGAGGYGFWSAMKDPMVWHFGFLLGLSSVGEMGISNWGGLYLQDVYGLDPKTTGAAFVSLFYILYTVARLFGGFVIEKAGYLRSLLAAVAAILVLLAAGFSLGRNGIWLLPLTGLFLAILYPTLLAVSAGIFRERAQTASSAIIVISFSLNGIIQYSIGLVNRYIGPAWGYRSCILYILVLGILLYRLERSPVLT